VRRRWHRVGLTVHVTATLVRALALQVDLGLGDVNENIEEMADLCDALLNDDISIESLLESLTLPIVAFARTVRVRLDGLPGSRIPSEKVIKCLQKAAIRLPI
jgi:hypothetical protein